jgi:hypothetical protein
VYGHYRFAAAVANVVDAEWTCWRTQARSLSTELSPRSRGPRLSTFSSVAEVVGMNDTGGVRAPRPPAGSMSGRITHTLTGVAEDGR